jgi:hypothetical protein
MMLHLTPRDAATLVAALHAWQNELSYHTVEELAGWHPELRDHRPLTIEEVDGLLRRMAPASPIEGGESAVSNVSTVSAEGEGGGS